ncbi:PREDICTED: PAP-specific phosphatase HAL2-like [Ipomoea nil]|uniref:PAP-specific phosphatase HAL2-like n=1 Tax=Ipomoea nil TaxID=35883 RepID=UPI0009015406|nr:PREDICTED: PAP-specific phosphatase HAL2-like [Ipomoea nil]
MDKGKYSEELNVAVRVVHMACFLCQKVQKGLSFSISDDVVQSKDDDSPVTIADWSVQATVSWILSENFGAENVSIVAEEDVRTLSMSESAGILDKVITTVNECLAEAPRYGLKGPGVALERSQVLEAIRRCNSSGGPVGRHWVLDPVDGTLGFVRRDQYAVALALVDNGEVVIGVLGCPNYPMKVQLNNQNQQNHTMPDIYWTSTGKHEEGCVMYTSRGCGRSWMQPLVFDTDKKFEWPNFAREIRVSSIDDPELATICEPVERANTNHSFTAGLASSVGLRKQPLRVYSMVKYAAIACGNAEIFMKFARAGYKEKIWDHAAGVLLVEEAGGVVTDAGGRPLDFSRGVYLEGLDRGIVACSGVKLHDAIIGAVYASWESSSL